MPLIMSLETDIIPCLGVDHVSRLSHHHLVEVLQQCSQLLQHEQDVGHPPTRSIPPHPDIKSAARISKADSETVEGGTAPIGAVSRERFSYWYLDLLLFTFSETKKRKAVGPMAPG